MKKMISALAALAMLAGCSSSSAPAASAAPAETKTEVVDSYTSASATKTTLAGDELSAAQDLLVSVSSDLASKADTEAEGYAAPENALLAQIMSVNPDGSVGFSTIHAWEFFKDSNTVEIEVTEGQNAQNLIKDGARGSLLVHCEDGWYLLHLAMSEVDTLEYSDEAFNEGKFNVDYSGAKYALNEYHITFNVLAIEKTNVVVIM